MMKEVGGFDVTMNDVVLMQVRYGAKQGSHIALHVWNAHLLEIVLEVLVFKIWKHHNNVLVHSKSVQ